MVNDIDDNEIKQITENVHNQKTEIYIPCIKTYGDILGEENKFTDSAEIFFEYCALHKSQDVELKRRMKPVRVFRTSPIVEDLLEIANKEWEETKGGWIGEQYNHPEGSSIERLDYDAESFDLCLHENDIRITLTTTQLKILIDMLKEFDKEELKYTFDEKGENK